MTPIEPFDLTAFFRGGPLSRRITAPNGKWFEVSRRDESKRLLPLLIEILALSTRLSWQKSVP